MSNTYNIGESTADINLAVDITSIGLAASRASVGDPGVVVAHSVDATGNIATQSIGNTTTLKGKRLIVFTKISLTGDDAAARQAEADQITGSYTFSGGDDGDKSFDNPISNFIDPNVFLSFVVDLA